MQCCRTPLAAGVAQNFVNLSLDILLVVALGVGVVCLLAHWAELLSPSSCLNAAIAITSVAMCNSNCLLLPLSLCSDYVQQQLHPSAVECCAQAETPTRCAGSEPFTTCAFQDEIIYIGSSCMRHAGDTCLMCSAVGRCQRGNSGAVHWGSRHADHASAQGPAAAQGPASAAPAATVGGHPAPGHPLRLLHRRRGHCAADGNQPGNRCAHFLPSMHAACACSPL